MSVEIEISDEDIEYAESLLFARGQKFDNERREFIKDLSTLDLQAVPGSGKTTALLAKLIILERLMPFDNGASILVLAHTNVAIDEIKERIGKHCPKLFSYPNFVGTIQGFVDQFLAVPFYINKYKKNICRIDNEIYYEVVDKLFSLNLKGLTEQNNARSYLRGMGENYKYSYRLTFNNGDLQVSNSVQGEELKIKKKGNRGDYSEDDKRKIKEWLIAFKRKILSCGILHFDDAYFLAEVYLYRNSKIKNILQNRFQYVFVDEMQDMGKHQYDLLEKIFFDSGNSKSIYQRIGDKNQAIFNEKLEDIWTDRQKVLRIQGSHRLTQETADLVSCFALNREQDNQIRGLRSGNIRPHFIVYEDCSKVIEGFSSLVNKFIVNGVIDSSGSTFKAIAWVKESDDISNKLCLKSYFPEFESEQHKPKIDYTSIESYLLYYDKTDNTLRSIKNNILNLILRIFRYEDITNEDDRNFNRKTFTDYFKVNLTSHNDKLNLLIFRWSLEVMKGSVSKVSNEIRQYIPDILSAFNKQINHSSEFINTSNTNSTTSITSTIPASVNTVNFHEFNIDITTIHSVKGQTFTAILYLETFYYKDGKKSYESQRLSEQFNFSPLSGNEGQRVKQSAKMVYVGLSRPTHLLCVAIQKDRFDKYLRQNVDTQGKWEIIDL
jgi:DNA helicase II / ATP-dependent DNA helicase PcrA